MVFLNINNIDKDKTNKLKKYYSSPARIFMLIYMNGCGPCEATKPEWAKLPNVLNKYKNNEDVVIVDIDKDILPKIQLDGLKEPSGFPTIIHLNNKKSESYEDDSSLGDSEKDRTVDSFVKWIENNVKNKQGGSRKKTRRQNMKQRKTRRNIRTKQGKKYRKNRRTRK
jgi:vacuolar-type H+-ATPase subunit F/Vma7